jgi:hypothetical protein
MSWCCDRGLPCVAHSCAAAVVCAVLAWVCSVATEAFPGSDARARRLPTQSELDSSGALVEVASQNMWKLEQAYALALARVQGGAKGGAKAKGGDVGPGAAGGVAPRPPDARPPGEARKAPSFRTAMVTAGPGPGP